MQFQKLRAQASEGTWAQHGRVLRTGGPMGLLPTKLPPVQKQNNLKAPSHHSMGLKSWHGVTGFFAQGLTGLTSRRVSSLRLGVLFQAPWKLREFSSLGF